ncbi:MAG: sulfite exporter TauE/SafE family protein [Nitrosomonadales bacterium]|nr:sulfite exporter TauE/SafE family protein [Nitrosomonadales bacterium]
MEWYAAYLALGAVAGFLAGLFGVGGGLVLVPLLLFLFDAQHFPSENAMHMALGTSMATIVFTSLASLRKHHQHGAVNWRVVRSITPGILLGTALGTLSAASISPRGLGVFFALFVYFAAAQILLDARPQASRQLPGFAGMGSVGTFTGWISSLVSIGGGTVIVPFLVWCNVPLRNAIGTSAAIGFPIAVGGTAGYIATGLSLHTLPAPHLGFVYLPALMWVAFAAVITAPLGAKATHHMKVGLLRKLFAVLLIVLATKLLLKVL